MSAFHRFVVPLACALLSACGEPSAPQPTTSVCFSTEILPLIDAGCAKSGCHDADILDDDDMVVPFNPDESELMRVVTTDEADNHMPPRPWPSFNAEQRDRIRRWILEGASRTTCDSPVDTSQTTLTYAAAIKPLVDVYCVGCHLRQVSGSGPILTTYERVRDEIVNGHFMETVRHDDGYPPMPPGRTRMTEREIMMLDVWIKRGMPR